MTYLTELSSGFSTEKFLLKIEPRTAIQISAMTSHNSFSYKTTVTLGRVSKVFVYNQQFGEYEEDTAIPTTNNSAKWFFDEATDTLYVSKFGNPASTDYVTFHVEILVSTEDVAWYRVPTDSTKTISDWTAALLSVPSIKYTLSDQLLGYIPAQESSVLISNADHLFEEYLDDYSFNKIPVSVWHWLGADDVANIRLVYQGLVTNLQYDDRQISFSLRDNVDILNTQYKKFKDNNYSETVPSAWTYTVGINNYTQGTEPGAFGRPARGWYGYNKNVVPYNISYDESSPGVTYGNDIWAIDNAHNVVNVPNVFRLINGSVIDTSGSHTTTRIYLSINPTTNDALYVGESIVICAAGAFDYGSADGHTITARGANYIDFTPALGAPFDDATQAVYAWMIPFATVEREGVLYDGVANKHYRFDAMATTNGNFSTDILLWGEGAGYPTYYTDMGLASEITYTDKVYFPVVRDFRIAGPGAADPNGVDTYETISGNEIGAYNWTKMSYTNGVGILLKIMKQNLGYVSSDFDLTSWDTLADTLADVQIGFMNAEYGSDYPFFSEIITNICNSLKIRLFRNENNKWELSQIAALTTPTTEFTDNDIYEGSFSVSQSYEDIIYEAKVEYEPRDRNDAPEASSPTSSVVTSQNNFVISKHAIKNTRTFKTYLVSSSDASDLAEFYVNYFSERRARMTVTVSKENILTTISDLVRVTKLALPGFAYDGSTENSRDTVVIEYSKNDKGVTLTLDDQKGLEDNI